MKKLMITAAMLALFMAATAQSVNKLITQKDVERIIRTLSADDMEGRATYTPGIEKAAQFIENEFKTIGLKPMKGNTGYRQNFHLIHVSPGKTQANINGEGIPSDHVLAFGNANYSWNNNTGVQVVKETSDQNFRMDYRKYLRSGKKMLVLVDPSFEALFKQMRNRAAGGSLVTTLNPDLAVAFVLGKFDEVKSFEVNYEVKIEDQQKPLFNLAGVIPGKTRPNEYVIFSGHYDHLGIKPGLKPDSIFNGADDDASGITAMIALARYYKKLHNNARTLIFVAFTAEEMGELGSEYFAATINPDKVVAMFNIEMIGKPSKFGEHSAFITGFDRSSFGRILQRNLKGTPFKFYPDPYKEQDLFYRSDNASLAKVGVPAHTISTDQIDVDNDYHQVTDELKTLDVANITSAIRAIALSSRTIVSGKDTPTRVPKLER